MVVQGDAVRLAQVVSNLIISATRRTPEAGNLIVGASSVADKLAITVRDDRIAISPAQQPALFDLFQKGPRSPDESQAGLGIGRYVSRTLVELHEGNLSVSSGPGGSEFQVLLPLISNGPAPVMHASVALQPGRSRRILIIKDNVDASDTLKNFLSLQGHQVTAVSNGPAGLELAREQRFDVVICDIGLPDMNGFELVSRARSVRNGPQPCLIAVTGYDHYLLKPVSTIVLRQLILLSGTI